jgi:hypothetical protein
LRSSYVAECRLRTFDRMGYVREVPKAVMSSCSNQM